MKLARLGLLVSFAVLLCIRTSQGAQWLTARYGLVADADDSTVPNPVEGQSDRKVGGVLWADYRGNEYLFQPHAQAMDGGTSASLHATARANIGSIGVGIVGGVATNSTGGGQVQANYVEAGWHDGMVVRSRSRPPGTILVFNMLLELEYEQHASVTPPPPPFALGGAFSDLEIFEASPDYNLPPAPYPTINNPAGYWAQVREGNQSVNNLPLPIIRVRHEMKVGRPFQLDYNMRLTGGASAANGGTALIYADYTMSLKWGGVESVTDFFGNPIPRDDWTIESESGFDYSRSFDNQVPEPASAALWGLPLCLWFGRARIRVPEPLCL